MCNNPSSAFVFTKGRRDKPGKGNCVKQIKPAFIKTLTPTELLPLDLNKVRWVILCGDFHFPKLDAAYSC